MNRQPSIQILQLCSDEGDLVRFNRLATLLNSSYLRCLRGDRVGFALHQELSAPCIWNWKTDKIIHLRDRPNPYVRAHHYLIVIASYP